MEKCRSEAKLHGGKIANVSYGRWFVGKNQGEEVKKEEREENKEEKRRREGGERLTDTFFGQMIGTNCKGNLG